MCCYVLLSNVIGVSLNEFHTSGKNGTNIAFTKIYAEIWINGTSIMCSQRFTFKSRVITDKCFRLCVHHANDHQSSLLTFHVRLVHAFITQKSYQSSLLTLHIRVVRMFITQRITVSQ